MEVPIEGEVSAREDRVGREHREGWITSETSGNERLLVAAAESLPGPVVECVPIRRPLRHVAAPPRNELGLARVGEAPHVDLAGAGFIRPIGGERPVRGERRVDVPVLRRMVDLRAVPFDVVPPQMHGSARSVPEEKHVFFGPLGRLLLSRAAHDERRGSVVTYRLDEEVRLVGPLPLRPERDSCSVRRPDGIRIRALEGEGPGQVPQHDVVRIDVLWTGGRLRPVARVDDRFAVRSPTNPTHTSRRQVVDLDVALQVHDQEPLVGGSPTPPP